MMVIRFALLLVLGSSLVIALPAEKNPDGDDYDYENENEPSKVEPKGDVKVDNPEFISTNRPYEAVIGSDLTLACQVNKLLEETPLIWSVKYSHDVTSANPTILVVGDKWLQGGDHSKFQLTPLTNNGEAEGNTLTVKNVTPSDAGKYVCKIALTVPKEVIFDVAVVAESKEHHTDAATTGVAQTSQCDIAVLLMTLVVAFVLRV